MKHLPAGIETLGGCTTQPSRDDLIENVERCRLGLHAFHYQNSSQVIREVSQFLGG
jgi:hypothetical protein